MSSFISSLQFENPGIFTLEGIAAITFFFMVYSFFGWLLENSYNFFTTGHFLKANFLRGPFKPMYGFAPVLLVYLIGQGTHWGTILFLCFFIPTTVEFVSGALLHKVFRKKWWDYSNMPMQISGHICLPFSLAWTFLSFIALKWIHPLVSSLLEVIGPYWIWFFLVIVACFVVDLYWAVRRHSVPHLYLVKPTNTVR